MGIGLIALGAVLAVDAAILASILFARVRAARRARRSAWIRRFLRVAFATARQDEVERAVSSDPVAFLSEYLALSDSVTIAATRRAVVEAALARTRTLPRLVAGLQSRDPTRRAESAIWLGCAAPSTALVPLERALAVERTQSVRLHLAYALVSLGEPAIVPAIVDTLAGSDEEYQRRVYGLLATLGADLHDYFDVLSARTEPEIESLLIRIASDRGDAVGQEYLLRVVAGAGPHATDAVRALLAAYIDSVDLDALLASDDRLTVNLTLEAMGRLDPSRGLSTLLGALDDPDLSKSALVGLSRLVHDHPRLYRTLETEAIRSAPGARRDAVLEVLANRVEYLLERLIRGRDETVALTVRLLVESGRVSGVLAFLSRNHDPLVEQRVVGELKDAVLRSDAARVQFAQYASDSVLDRLEIDRVAIDRRRSDRSAEAVRPRFILGILGLTVVVPIAVFAGYHLLSGGMPTGWFADYANRFTIGFGVYAFALNAIYLGLLGLAAVEVRRQSRRTAIKPLSMLFADGMLPPISILVPAFREEATIVESVTSLLNLRYPAFEVIVVNDGSPDRTLDALIDAFELERTDVFVHGYLGTAPVHGFYRNPRIPELLVIDKQNGGKADSLNAGINAARNPYFAAIDSDSLLERDSLLRLAELMLDSERPMVAVGGNILPVNGCTVSHGHLDDIRLPREPLALFQSLEYVRSFMAGRTGWARVNALMIISGAFGLFRTRDVVDAHGYLTASGYYTKDTVAEDMELVVRVARRLYERRDRFAIGYAYRANCWTEVPTTHRILRNQRDRWQRGLIDTMSYHRRMVGNPRYGAMGLIGFPYFAFFELLGPWFELQGILFLVAGLIAGLLDPVVVAVVLVATIPLGVAVSLSSLLLAEYRHGYFSRRDRLLFIVLAVVENVGYRQYAGLIRLRGYISALFRKTGWGTMVRVGFSGPTATGHRLRGRRKE